jgi:ABC-2 type transport system permease protein
MSVYKRGYEKYRGTLRGRRARFMVLPRHTWRQLFRQRLVVLLMAVAMIYPLLSVLYIYLSNNTDLLAGFSGPFQSILAIDPAFFMTFMNTQAVFAVFLAALAGPGLIAPDLADNALQLYFSRPLTRLEYVAARLVTLFCLLSLVTWIPGLLLFGMQSGMAEPSWFSAHWKLAGGLTAGLILWVLLVSLVALTGSAYAKLKVIAGGMVLGFFFIPGGVAMMINGVFRSTWGHLLNPAWTVRRLWHALLTVDAPEGPGIAISLLAVAATIVLLALVLERKLRPVEVAS